MIKDTALIYEVCGKRVEKDYNREKIELYLNKGSMV